MIARSNISQNDLDLTELESIKLWGRPGAAHSLSSTQVTMHCKHCVARDPKSKALSFAIIPSFSMRPGSTTTRGRPLPGLTHPGAPAL